MSDMVRIVVMASGRGSNFQAVVRAMEEGRIPRGRIVGLVTDRPGTGAGAIAESAGIPVHVIDYKSLAGRSVFDVALEERLASLEPDLILALGFMRIISSSIVRRYAGRMINIHPALLPAFPGMHAQRQALEYGVKISGATVHFVDEGVDTGPIILQSAVDVPEGSDEASLSARILVEEHRILVEAVRLFCDGRLRMNGRRVEILEEKR